MTTRDDDILDFDFVDEGATRESARREGPAGQPGGPRRPRLRAPGGITPLLRLVGLIAFAILVVVLLVVWAQGCASDRKRETYDRYMGNIKAVGDESARIGKSLAELLTTPGLKQTELETKIGGLVQQQQLNVSRGVDLDPPGPVRPQHEQALASLRFRVTGIQGLLAVFKATRASKDASVSGQRLAAQGQRLITSDVIWDDLFRTPSQDELRSRDISGVAVPDSNFAPNTELYGARSMTAIWQRVHGASTGGTPSGLHGTGLAYLKVLPGGQTLSTAAEATIQSSTELGFEVGVTNTGDNQEVRIEVTLTIPKQPSPIAKKGTIDLIDPGETKAVTFKDIGEPPFGEKTTIKVDIKPVTGERNTANNTAEYPVIFSLG